MKLFPICRPLRLVSLMIIIVFVYCPILQAQGIYQNWGSTYQGGTDNIGVVFSTDSSGGTLTGRHTFTIMNKVASPNFGAMTAFNGKLYGMASGEPTPHGKSVIFEYDPVAGTCIPKVSIAGTNGWSNVSLTLYNNQLYGFAGGSFGAGEIFKYDPVTGLYTKLIDFVAGTGSNPTGNLLVFNNKMYGVTENGGGDHNDYGVLFEYDPTTNIYTKKANLIDIYGEHPTGSLVMLNNKIYGLTRGGAGPGPDGVYGIIFEYDPFTGNISKKMSFNPSNGLPLMGSLLAINGKLWGLTQLGGSNNKGVLFQYDPGTNIYSKKVDLTQSGGWHPSGELIVSGTKLLGLTVYGGNDDLGVLFEYDTLTNTYIKRVDFSSLNGSGPTGTLTLLNNTIYGYTGTGGSGGYGVIFEYNPTTFQYTKKIDFMATEGELPTGSLTYCNKNLYGLTYNGGTRGSGVLYKYDLSDYTTTIEVNFDALNGGYPLSDLVAYNNKLYGMTNEGGAYGVGVIFSYDPVAKTYAKLVDFDSLNGGTVYDYWYQNNMVVFNNKLYGTTQSYGINNSGVLFEYNPANNVYTKKYDFDSASGGQPSGTLIPWNGKLYGITLSGGSYNEGVLFEYDPINNIYSKKIDFQSPGSYGGGGYLSLFNNKIYGLWSGDEANDAGLIFEYDPATNVYQKKLNLDTTSGKAPYGTLMLRNNLFYGTTFYGGAYKQGEVFEYNPVTNTYAKKADFDSTHTGFGPSGTLVSIPAAVAGGTIGSCDALPSFAIDNTNNSSWQAITDQWGNAIAEINPNGNNLGAITASLYVQNDPVRIAGGLNYLNRSITIRVQNQPAAGHPVDVRLYIKKSELDDLINTPGSGITSVNDLVVYKSENDCSDTVGINVVKLNTTASGWGTNYVLTTQVTSFSTFHFSSANAAMPVTLLSFSATRKNKNQNELDWQTSSESNSSSFDIERSLNGSLFTIIGSIPAAGTSNVMKRYLFNDNYPIAGADLYYRLKMKDLDSKFKYSDIVRLNAGGAPGVVISPNPVLDMLVIKNAGQFSKIQIIDASGRTIRQLPLATSNQYDVSDLKQGVYLIRLVNNKEVFVTKVLKL